MCNPNINGTKDGGLCQPMMDIKAEDIVKVLLVKITNPIWGGLGAPPLPVIIIITLTVVLAAILLSSRDKSIVPWKWAFKYMGSSSSTHNEKGVFAAPPDGAWIEHERTPRVGLVAARPDQRPQGPGPVRPPSEANSYPDQLPLTATTHDEGRTGILRTRAATGHDTGTVTRGLPVALPCAPGTPCPWTCLLYTSDAADE